jgi:hypothetical protein
MSWTNYLRAEESEKGTIGGLERSFSFVIRMSSGSETNLRILPTVKYLPMKKLIPSLIRSSFFIGLLFAAGCASKDTPELGGCNDRASLNYNPEATVNDGSCIYPIKLTQEQLDAVTAVHRLDITGRHENKVEGTSIHNDEIGDSTIRDIFADRPLPASGRLDPGTLIVRKVYHKLPNGKRGPFMEHTIMLQQPKGYNPAAYDLEFILLDDVNQVSAKHPNGDLSKVKSGHRGKVTECITCHSLKSNKDGVFTNTP